MQNVSIKKFADMCYIKDSAYIRQLLLSKKLEGLKQGRGWVIDIENPINAEYLHKRMQEYGNTTIENTDNTCF